MKKLVHLLIFSFLCCTVQASFAQNAGLLTGMIKDEKGEALSYGTVSLLKMPEASVVNGAGVEVDGTFKMPAPAPGSYLLRISALGFAALDTPPFTVTAGGFSKDFGTMVLKSDSKILKEVTVEAMRPTVVHHPDKMVVSVEGTAMAAGSTALEVLSKAPGVWVDQDGNIQLNGKAGVRMMIDGKLTYLTGKQLQTMLQSMPAENIKDLEIISNPSSKYDAEGNSGIINLNLKRNTQVGMNGSVYTGYQFNGQHGFNTGANVNYKTSRWSSFANVDVSRRVNLRTNTMTRVFNSEKGATYFDQSGDELGVRLVPSLRAGTDYDFNDRHSIGATANYTALTWDNAYDTHTYLRNGDLAENEFIRANNKVDGDYYNITLNGHYVFKIDTLGSSLSADVDYVQIKDQDNSRFLNTFAYPNSTKPALVQNLGSDNPTKYHIYSAKADYTKKFLNKSKLEAGVKTSYVTSDNQLKFFFLEGSNQVNDPTRSNHFIYQENIYAGYVNYTMNLGTTWSVQTGLRAEHTVSEGYSKTLDQTTPREYLNFFPSVFVQQKVSDNYQLTYNYSRRINRPNYGSLNPFIFYLDPLTWAQGNPYLRPQYSNSFQVTQTFKNTYILTLGYSKTTDFIAEIPEQNTENNTSVFGPRNVDDFDSYFGTLVAPVKISNKWDINNNLTLGYQAYSISIRDKVQENKQFYYMLNSNHTVQLPRKFKMELNAGYQGPNAYGLYKIEQNWWLDAAVKRSFLNDQLEASLAVTDIFRTRKVVGAANIDGNINAFDQYFGAQSVRLNLRYRFNKGQKFEMQRRNTTLEESNRAGG
ncbi:outer membrane beta-barrel protein [Rufibacter sp. XAAS-G3-1]|uniref:outer membrane beta-barrel protein n=1 Tax=Rufibacter sp. XAAS-G3-1 TaxID=2729134 RepID=UPI0015E79D92|nr:outer membrane beta-barrel protein [Rufibacter sp. XAAS-G3-1]